MKIVPGPTADGGTRVRVVRSLLSDGPATAAALAARLGLTSAAVRRHLDALLLEGQVSGSDRPPYGPDPRRGRGRPARVFALTELGRDTFHQAYDDLASQALRYLAEVGGAEAVDTFARRRLDRIRERYQPLVLAAAPDQQGAALAAALTSEGYAASMAPGPDGLGGQLCQHHCPVAHVAAEFPQLCEAETELFAELLGTHVQRLATIAAGAHVCTTVIQRPPHLQPARSATSEGTAS